jgi:exodeoxyribonuclease-3
MHIITLNLNGIRSAIAKGLMEFLADQQPDVVCFQELKADEAVLKALQAQYFTDWHCVWHPAEKKGYSGVGVIARSLYSEVAVGIGMPFDSEGRVIEIRFGDLTIWNAYFPSGTQGAERQAVKEEFLVKVWPVLEALRTEKQRVLLCGDFNICHQPIDLYNPDSATKQKLSGFLPQERRWLDQLQAAGWHDLYRQLYPDAQGHYSWFSQRFNARPTGRGWRIDHFWGTTAVASAVLSAHIHQQPVLSDHNPVSLKLTL